MGPRDDHGGRRIGRRPLLIASVTGLAGAGAAVVAGSSTPPDVRPAPAASPVPHPPALTTVDRVYSPSRRREVEIVTLLPAHRPPGPLPVCLFLHGRFGSARRAVPPGLRDELMSAVARGSVPPFAFVTVDGGGNSYWHDDPMRMLLDEVPGWLRARGLGDAATGTPFACAGVSMGGFGALLYARRRQERGNPARAVATIAPALITSWQEMRSRKAFQDMWQWAELDPLRHVKELGRVPVGLWCGTEDPFVEGVRKFVRQARPEVAFLGPGGHNDGFYRRILPDMVRFLGRKLGSGAAG
ncbi:S-formylglutathione hydrolase FrmB [Herbihabitans rhizosphaerae]|uniref:S-formylglutathione hydrolase FrmB n=1 Tax=Herbihabitans rhizosphaerae TaxID=1872711 RepID=A0A4Q7KDN6_9PSEU|nr:alpha/beta hydrolase-fold protein [Herbihabitans rhizosphaerae]RZS31354.1 S-formylglutathione hydrolase FrmB [Herbihabitans rhizosphaerae]